MSRFSHRTQAELAILLVAIIWGTTFVVVKEALADIGPFLFIGIRFIIAFFVLALLSYQNIRQIRRSTVMAGCLLGFFLFIGYIFQTAGLKYTTSTNAGFITGVSVVLVPLLYSVLHRVLPAWMTVVTSLLAVSGLYLMSVPAGSFSLSYGDFLVLICAFGFALHIVFVDHYSYRHNAVAITGVQILFVGLVSLVLGLFFEPIPSSISANTMVAIFITAVFATALAFLIQNALQKYSTPSRFAVVLTTEPVFAALAGFLWAGEVFTLRTFIGAGLILLSMFIAITTRKSKKTVVATHS